MPDAEPTDRAALFLGRARELLLECRAVVQQLERTPENESPSAAAERIAFGVLVAALEEGLVKALEHATEVLSHFRAAAGPLGEEWLRGQDKKLGRG